MSARKAVIRGRRIPIVPTHPGQEVSFTVDAWRSVSRRPYSSSSFTSPRSAFDFWFESLRGRTRLYLDSVAYLNTLNGTFVEFEIQTND